MIYPVYIHTVNENEFEDFFPLRASGSSTNVHTGIGDASRIVWFANRICATDIRNKFLAIH
jgi:hypothetical protein